LRRAAVAPFWRAGSPIAALVLAFLVYELISVRRSMRRDREKAATDAQARPVETPSENITT
jgi:hypothetical protein